MKSVNRLTLIAASFAALLAGCKSAYEKHGDAHLKENRPLQALQNYELVLQKGKPSAEFAQNYIKANIMAMSQRNAEDPLAEFMDHFKENIEKNLSQAPNAENEAAFADVLLKVGKARLAMGTPISAVKGFDFMRAAEVLPSASGAVKQEVSQIRDQYVSGKLGEVRDHLEEAKTGEVIAGIVADYKLAHMDLVAGSTEESEALWSEVRKANLATYLMYDNTDVEMEIGGSIDHRINKYGVLLGITKYKPAGSSVYLEVKAFNGTNNPIDYKKDSFALVDSDGNRHEPVSGRGFKKDAKVSLTEESPVAGLKFKLPGETQVSHLEYKYGSGVSEKFLP